MFERFTDRARRVLVLAQEEARVLNHNFLGTEHLLLGLIHEGEGVGAVALESLGIDLAECRREVEQIIGPAGTAASGTAPPFTPRAKKVLEFSLREALALGHNYIGTEHLLLGLIQEGEGVGAQVLIKLGADLGAVRQKVIELLSGHGTVATRGTRTWRERSTPAGMALSATAATLAGSKPVGTQHYLLGMLDHGDSLAARVLASLGVTAEAVSERIATLGIAGTSDEVAPTSPGFELGLGGGMTLRVDDVSLADDLRVAIEAAGDVAQAGDLATFIRKAIAEHLQQAEGGSEPPDTTDQPETRDPPNPE